MKIEEYVFIISNMNSAARGLRIWKILLYVGRILLSKFTEKKHMNDLAVDALAPCIAILVVATASSIYRYDKSVSVFRGEWVEPTEPSRCWKAMRNRMYYLKTDHC